MHQFTCFEKLLRFTFNFLWLPIPLLSKVRDWRIQSYTPAVLEIDFSPFPPFSFQAPQRLSIIYHPPQSIELFSRLINFMWQLWLQFPIIICVLIPPISSPCPLIRILILSYASSYPLIRVLILSYTSLSSHTGSNPVKNAFWEGQHMRQQELISVRMGGHGGHSWIWYSVLILTCGGWTLSYPPVNSNICVLILSYSVLILSYPSLSSHDASSSSHTRPRPLIRVLILSYCVLILSYASSSSHTRPHSLIRVLILSYPSLILSYPSSSSYASSSSHTRPHFLISRLHPLIRGLVLSYSVLILSYASLSSHTCPHSLIRVLILSYASSLSRSVLILSYLSSFLIQVLILSYRVLILSYRVLILLYASSSYHIRLNSIISHPHPLIRVLILSYPS